jgi:hypothetical protein
VRPGVVDLGHRVVPAPPEARKRRRLYCERARTDWPTSRGPAGRASSAPGSWPGQRLWLVSCPPRAGRHWTCPELARRRRLKALAVPVVDLRARPALRPQAGRVPDLCQRTWEGEPLGEDEYLLSTDEKPGVQARA